MKKYLFIPILFISALCWGQAQFVVQNGNKTEVYLNINDAITNAIAGDTLYIPGGGFAISNTTIDKALHWVGHGHYPAATAATLQSRITSNLIFDGSCDNSSFEGIWFTGTLTFGSSGDEIENIVMKRCRVSQTMNLRRVETGSPNLNFIIAECIINGILNAKNGSNCKVSNSILLNTISRFYQSEFVNIIHLPDEEGYYDAETIEYCGSCIFKNSIFTGFSGTEHTSSCTFSNNILTRSTFTGDYENPGTGNVFQNNIFSVPIANIFITLTDNPWVFSYENDYHLVSESPGKLHGDDNLDVGIYGSIIPYKENAIPYYPHINTANVASQAVNNTLGIQINVQAQER